MWTDPTLGWLFVAVVSGEDGDGTQTGLPRTDTVAKQAQLRARWALSRTSPRLSCDDRLNGYVERSELTEGEFVVGPWADSHTGDDAARRDSLHRRRQRLQAGAVAQATETPAREGARGPCGDTCTVAPRCGADRLERPRAMVIAALDCICVITQERRPHVRGLGERPSIHGGERGGQVAGTRNNTPGDVSRVQRTQRIPIATLAGLKGGGRDGLALG